MRNYLITACLLAVPFAAGAVNYTITDLGTLGGNHSIGNDVNDYGQVTGYFGDGTWNYHAFIGSSNGLQDLGTLGGSGYSYGDAINNSALVVGVTDTDAFIGNENGIDYIPSSGQKIGDRGHGINDAGDVAITRTNYGSGNLAYIYDELGYRSIGLGSNSTAYDINNNKQVTGFFQQSGNATAYIWDETNGSESLGTLGGSTSYGIRINNSGFVTGSSLLAGDNIRHAFIGDLSGGLTDLGTLFGDSLSEDINDYSQIVGSSIMQNGDSHAFYWDEDSGMLDLNDMVTDLTGWDYLFEAKGISNTGYIIGTGVTSDGANHAYLLTAVPIPAAVWLFGSGLIGLIGIARRKSLSKTHS